jgi:hypothetical protein
MLFTDKREIIQFKALDFMFKFDLLHGLLIRKAKKITTVTR